MSKMRQERTGRRNLLPTLCSRTQTLRAHRQSVCCRRLDAGRNSGVLRCLRNLTQRPYPSLLMVSSSNRSKMVLLRSDLDRLLFLRFSARRGRDDAGLCAQKTSIGRDSGHPVRDLRSRHVGHINHNSRVQRPLLNTVLLSARFSSSAQRNFADLSKKTRVQMISGHS
jgi:hypothetical protein